MEWLFVVIGILIVAALGHLVLHAHRSERLLLDLYRRSTSLATGDVSLLQTAIRDLRTHMVSNHDEIDADTRFLREKAIWLVAHFDRYLRFDVAPPPSPKDQPVPTVDNDIDPTHRG